MKPQIMFMLAAIVLAVALAAAPLFGQGVRLRAGDSIRLDVPGRDDLGRLLTIDPKGQVSLPIVGSVHVEGLTLEEAKGTLQRAIQEVYPSVQSITLSLIGEEARRVIYVQGQVVRPGKYEFPGTATVWDAIKEAGGATIAGSLGAVRIIHATGESGAPTVVDIQGALDAGDLSSMPTLRPGDTVIVPERSATYGGTGAVNVFGAVLHPAAYMLTGEKHLTDAILAAGGPIDGAKLGEVTIVRSDAGGKPLRIHVDFKRFLEKGDLRGNPPVLPNDTVNVPKGGTFWSTISNPNFILAFVTTCATVATVVLYSH